jgi:predicted ATPase
MPGSIPTLLSAGTRLGSYEILEKLGAGGMGEVYRARDTRLGREVAIKTVSLETQSQPDAIARFEQEARSASALNHPNIVTIYELGTVDGTCYIAMELVRGQTLREMLSSGPLPFRKAVAIGVQIADALARSHAASIVHRDLKPENLMVSAEGTAKILDFGLAKLLVSRQAGTHDACTAVPPITQEGLVMGTTSYMSPEQACGREVDFRSDQFSFGSVLYEMVTGHPAFKKNTGAETVAAILRDEPHDIASRLPQAPAPFIWIVERCLAKEPEQRYASTHDLVRDLVAVRDRMPRPSEPRSNNLPVQRSTFIGRDHEVSALRELVRRKDVRIVTLTGPGGIGKSRLALQVASKSLTDFQGGVCFVALSGVTAWEDTIPAISQAIGVRETGNQAPGQSLKDSLAGLTQPLLLLLDNFEHLLAAASAITDLISFTQNLTILVTSQAPLHVYGEQEFPVTPLALPDSDLVSNIEALSRLPAIQLFVERAQAVKRDFLLTKENAAAVAAICARLDGLPLAIELAAARIKLLSPAAMLARLESSLTLLTGGARDLPQRQQTLRGTVEWSHSLLNPAEQVLFRRLAVFVGGCTLEAVEAVCDTKGDLGLDVLEGMTSMVDKSLVQQIEPAGGDTRFVMLSSLREYALERLAKSGDEPASRRAHAAYQLVLAEDGCKNAGAPDWLSRFDLEHANLRSAIDHLVRTNDTEWGHRLGTALFHWWEAREHLSEGREYITKLLNMAGSGSYPKLRSHLLFAGAVLAGEQGDYSAAQKLFEESLETSVELGDNRGVAVALNALAVNARDRNDLVNAALLFERCVLIWKDLGDPRDTARALSNLANVMKLRGEYATADSLYNECRAMFLKAGDGGGIAWTLNYQGDVAHQKGDLLAARSCYEESLAAFRHLDDSWGIASVLSDLANLHRDQRDDREAKRLYGESIRIFHTLGHKRGIARVLECLASAAAAQSHAQHSLRLAGAAAVLRQRLGAPLSRAEQSRLDVALEQAREKLGNTQGMAAWMEGWAMPVEQAVQEALNYAATCD